MRKSVVYRFFMGDLLELKVKRGKEKGLEGERGKYKGERRGSVES
jgi:hypothetical protein